MSKWTCTATYTADAGELRRTRQTQITAGRILSDRTIEQRLRDADPSAHAEYASVDAILEDVMHRLMGAGLALEHASEYGSLYFRGTDAIAGEVVIRVSDHALPETDERVWAREHGGRRCANREYIVAAAIGEEPMAAERIVDEILGDLREAE